MTMIQTNRLFTNKIKFEINDTYDTVWLAAKSRIDLFGFESVTKYNKILYLDTDIIVKDSVNKVFDAINDDILYVLREGNITEFFWGSQIFGNEASNYNDNSAFTTGIMLFNNCEKIRFLFDKVNEHINTRPCPDAFYEQAYIIYNAFKYKLYDNKTLESLVVNNDHNIHSNKVVHHFPGGVGNYLHKLDSMTKFLDAIKTSIPVPVYLANYRLRILRRIQ